MSDSHRDVHLLFVRHALAGDKKAFARSGRPDAERPITSKGRRRMMETARALRKLVDLDRLLTGPYKRARQTADIVAAAFTCNAEEDTRLQPNAPPESFFRSLRPTSHQRVIAIVGHEPTLSRWLAWCLTGQRRAFTELKKGGAALVRFSGTPARARGRLIWLLRPRDLRALARKN